MSWSFVYFLPCFEAVSSAASGLIFDIDERLRVLGIPTEGEVSTEPVEGTVPLEKTAIWSTWR